MKTLLVFDATLADTCRTSGCKEIITQYGVKEDVWVFDYSDPTRFFFDIDRAIEMNQCKIVSNIFMAF